MPPHPRHWRHRVALLGAIVALLVASAVVYRGSSAAPADRPDDPGTAAASTRAAEARPMREPERRVRSAREPVESEDTWHELEVVDAVTRRGIDGVRLVALRDGTATEMIASTDAIGRAGIPRDRLPADCALFHEEYEIVEAELSAETTEPIALRSRPRLLVTLEDADPQVVLSHRFFVHAAGGRGVFYTGLQRLLGVSIVPASDWTGLSVLELCLPAYEACDVRAEAALRGAVSPYTEARVHLSAPREVNDVHLTFVPPLRATVVDVAFRLHAAFPETARVRHHIEGPLASMTGPHTRVRGLSFQEEGEANRTTECVVEDVTPGVYVWSVLVYGFGTYELARFEVGEGDRQIDLRNEGSAFVSGTVEVIPHEGASTIDMRVLDGFTTVTGAVFRITDATPAPARFRHDYVVPRGAALFAQAYSLGDGKQTEETAVDTSVDGATAVLRRWSEPCRFTVAITDAPPRELRWVEIRNLASRSLRRTRARVGEPEVGPLELAPGAYEVRVCTVGRCGAWVPVDLPRDAGEVRVGW